MVSRKKVLTAIEGAAQMALGDAKVIAAFDKVIASFRAKGKEFAMILKMGRTQRAGRGSDHHQRQRPRPATAAETLSENSMLRKLKVTRLPSRVAIASLLIVGASQSIIAQAADSPAPRANIVVLATGGAIAGAAALDVQAGSASGQLAVDQLLAAVPQTKKLANLRGEQIANIGSQDMNDEVWMKLATRTNEVLAMPDVTGVVITHGADTIEETGYFLNLVINSAKPVVLTAGMRPATALSADGPLNFFNAVAVAADPQAVNRGVLVVVNEWIHGAASLTNASTTAVQTFLLPLSGLIGTVAYGETDFYRGPVGKNTVTSKFRVDKNTVLPRVDIIMAYENMDGKLIDAAVAAGAKGLVIAGVGNGNLTKPAIEALAAQAKRGIVCVRSSRVATGQVGWKVEVDDDKYGFVASLGLNPQKSRVLLRLALLSTSDPKLIQRYFDEY